MTNIELFQPNKYPLSNGIRLIEASAGTGKTFSLSHLVLRLLTEKEYSIKNLKILAFYPFKDEPFFLKSRLGLDFFSLNELNYYGFPNNSIVRNFMNESFDILIDLTQRRIVPLRVVLLFSKSSFKVGSFSDEKKPFYDLMIETDPSDYKEYVTQVTSYLKIFDKND